MVTKKETITVERNKEVGSAMMSVYCQKLLKQLTQNMIERGATTEDISVFQFEFCNANDIVVPDSFFPETLCLDLSDFVEQQLVESEKNIKAKDAYVRYVSWCKENGLQCKTKGCFFFELKKIGIFGSLGTVDGKSVKNVIKRHDFKFDIGD